MQTRTPEEARKLAEQHICLQCGAVDEYATVGKVTHKRGLCPADYEKHRRAKGKAVSKVEVRGMESILISRGLLLPDGRAASDPNIEALEAFRRLQAEAALQSQTADEADSISTEELKKIEKQNRVASAAYARDAISKRKQAKPKTDAPAKSEAKPTKKRKQA